jgi:heat shock protein HslJ
MSINRLASVILMFITCAGAGCAEWGKVLDSLGDEPVENTYWKLTQLNGAAVVAAERQRGPHFVLHPESGRVTGSGGCNSITGNYKLDGNRLSFGPLEGTMMSCHEGMEAERNFMATLQKGGRARIAGQRLELLDGGGQIVARFDAAYIK